MPRGAARLTDYQQNLVAWLVEVVSQLWEMHEIFCCLTVKCWRYFLRRARLVILPSMPRLAGVPINNRGF